jgi:triacylglycerol lipase
MPRPHTLIIDGIWARPKRWNPLREQLEEHCGSAEIWEYDSTGCRSFEDLGEILAQRIHEHDGEVNLVAFSMGGLVARAAHLMDPRIAVRRAVFLNSPHEGSLLAYLLPLHGVRQMRPTSPFMKQIKSDPWPIPTLIVWNPLDTMVVPGSSTRLKGATETMRCQVPIHLWPIWSRGIRRRVVQFLKAGEN